MKFGITFLAIGVGWTLPMFGFEFFGVPYTDRTGILHIVLSGMYGFTIYYWGRRLLPQKLKLLVIKVFNWSDNSQLGITTLLFVSCFFLGLLSTATLVAINRWY